MFLGQIFLLGAILQVTASWHLWRGWHPHSSRDRVLFMAAMTGAALTLPPTWALGLLLGLAFSGWMIWSFTVTTLLVNALLLGFLTGTPSAEVGPLAWSNDGAWLGVVGAARISAILIWNAWALKGAGHAWFLEALRLPKAAMVYVGAIWLSMTGLQEDWRNLKTLHEIEGTWPATRRGQLAFSLQLVPALLYRSHERARARQDALTLAGIQTPRWFAPFVAITALAAAGRLAFIALPNVALTYLFVFIGGLLYGPLVAMMAAAAAMAGTNLFLSGFAPSSFVNVPAMMLVGLIGGLVRGLNFRHVTGKMLAASIGFFATLLFSITADTISWALIPEFRGSVELLQVRIGAGLAFNVLPAVVNGFLFAAVSGPTQRAYGK